MSNSFYRDTNVTPPLEVEALTRVPSHDYIIEAEEIPGSKKE
jgi:hypothetical protein